jgi:hypothetical protein
MDRLVLWGKVQGISNRKLKVLYKRKRIERSRLCCNDQSLHIFVRSEKDNDLAGIIRDFAKGMAVT